MTTRSLAPRMGRVLEVAIAAAHPVATVLFKKTRRVTLLLFMSSSFENPLSGGAKGVSLAGWVFPVRHNPPLHPSSGGD